MPIADLDATLHARRDVADDLAFFDVELDHGLVGPEEGAPTFRPGQYVTVGVLDTEGGLVRRPMTLTSTPSSTRRIELLLNRVPTPASPSPLSHHLFALSPGDRLSVRPAATGRFTLEDTEVDGAARTLLIASGTGVAPFLSMIRSRAEAGATLDDLALVHRVEDPAWAAARDELSVLASRGLRYRVWTPSADGEVDAWLRDGAAAWLEAPITPSATRVLACGLGEVLRRVTFALLPLGYRPPHRRLRKALGIPLEAASTLHLEQFDSERLFDIKDEALMFELRAQLASGA